MKITLTKKENKIIILVIVITGFFLLILFDGFLSVIGTAITAWFLGKGIIYYWLKIDKTL